MSEGAHQLGIRSGPSTRRGTQTSHQSRGSHLSEDGLMETSFGKVPLRQRSISRAPTIRHSARRSHHSMNPQNSEEEETRPGYLTAYKRKNSQVSKQEIDKWRNDLSFSFQTPCEKFRSKKKFPFKLTLQLLKVFIVTLQCAIFSGERRSTEDFGKTSIAAFKHLFLKDYAADQETPNYPPALGPYAVYTQDDFYDHMDYLVSRYYRFDELTLSSVNHAADRGQIQLCVTDITQIELDQKKEWYFIDPNPKPERCCMIPETAKITGKNEDHERFDTKLFMNSHEECSNITTNRMMVVRAKFELAGFNIRHLENTIEQPVDDVDCVKFNVTVTYNNVKKTGQIRINLAALVDYKLCNLSSTHSEEQYNFSLRWVFTGFDMLVIFVCSISTVLAVRSVRKAVLQIRNTKRVFREYFGYRLTLPEHLEILSLWYFQIIISDILVIIGSALKINIRWGASSDSTTFDTDVLFLSASFLLGLANLFEWVGVIRYLGYFSKYYILMLTITHAAPAIIRFLVCVATIWIGFLMTGWIILGPYNIKFDSFSTTMDCLFSLVNGDEVYPTLATFTSEKDGYSIWIFSKIYLYAFIILYVFVVINLFVAVLSDSYETVKDWFENGMPKSFLQHFIENKIQEIEKDDSSDDSPYFQKLDEQEVDDAYGILAPIVCCLDVCVHHNVNSRRNEENDSENVAMIVSDGPAFTTDAVSIQLDTPIVTHNSNNNNQTNNNSNNLVRRPVPPTVNITTTNS